MCLSATEVISLLLVQQPTTPIIPGLPFPTDIIVHLTDFYDQLVTSDDTAGLVWLFDASILIKRGSWVIGE